MRKNYKYNSFFNNLIIISLFVLITNWDSYGLVWTPRNSPVGGYTGQIVSSGNILFCNANGSGIYQSNQTGFEWNKINTDIPDLQLIPNIAADNSYIYAASARGSVYRSNSNNINWKKIHNGETNSGIPFTINKIVIESSGIYLCTSHGLYKSINYGDSWIEIPTAGININISDIVDYDNKLYLTTSSGIYVSANLGLDWNSIGINSLLIYKTFKFNDVLYFCVHDNSGTSGFYFNIFEKYKTSDSVRIYQEDIFKDLQVIEISKFDTKIAASLIKFKDNKYTCNIVFSENSGSDWYKSYDSTFVNTEFITDGLLINNNLIFAGTQKSGVLRNNYFTGETTFIENYFHNIIIESLITDNNQFVAGTLRNGIYISKDFGFSWRLVQNSPKIGNDSYLRIIKLIKHNNLILAATDRGVYSSADNGESWLPVSSDIFITDIYSDGSGIYAVGNISAGQYIYSSDNGKTWGSQRIPNDALALGLLKDGNTIYINTSLGIYRSLDNGSNWQIVLQLKPADLYPSPMIKSGNNVISSSIGDLYLSNDGGTNWVKLQNAPNTNLIRDFKKLDNLLFMASNRGIFISLDNGINWSQANDGLAQGAVPVLSVNADSIYAAVSGNVIHSANAGDFSKIRITDISGEVFCTGMSLDISYIIDKKINFAPNNKFIAELSDANGSFNNGVTEIGFLESQNDGKITAIIPNNITFGTGYRIRIVSTYPPITGIDNLKGLTILEKKVPVITGELNVCTEKEYTYTTTENPGYNFLWQITNGTIIDFSSLSSVKVKWNSQGNGSLKVVQKNIEQCSDSSIFNVVINITPPKPVISKSGNTLISSIEFGNQWYFNDNIMTGDTSKTLSPMLEGIYRVKSKNQSGCESEISEAFSYTKDENSFLFAIDTISAYSGEDVFVNIRLIKNKKFYESGVRKITVTLVFNASLLYPDGENKGVVIDGKRYIQIELDTNYISGNIVKVLELKAMLGDAVSTEISITNLRINDLPEIAYKVDIGVFTLSGICYEGGARLVTSVQISSISSISPNPANESIEVQILTTESSSVKLYILNTLGLKVKELMSGNLSKGVHNLNFNISTLPIGDNYLILESGNEKSIGKFIITR
jgi:photosystem II stability/assembly factor-like uncharacterized protein